MSFDVNKIEIKIDGKSISESILPIVQNCVNEVNELETLLSVQSREIIELKQTIENQKEMLLKQSQWIDPKDYEWLIVGGGALNTRIYKNGSLVECKEISYHQLPSEDATVTIKY